MDDVLETGTGIGIGIGMVGLPATYLKYLFLSS